MTRILIIEDERPLLEEVCELLRFEGFEVIEANNGEEGLQLAEKELPDVILCDIMMPYLDGYGVLQRLRLHPALVTTPFIFLTAKAERGDARKGMVLGAEDYLTKPFTQEELLTTIHAQLQKHSVATNVTTQRIDALREHILTTVPHELRTPLVGIMGYSELLTSDAQTMTPDEVAEYGQIIFKASQRLHHSLENYIHFLQLQIASQNPGTPQALRSAATRFPGGILEEKVIAVADKAKRPTDLRLSIIDIPEIHMASFYLEKIAYELVDNAFKFSKIGTPVEVSTRIDNDQYMMTIRDAGRGMSREQIAEIGAFTQFNRSMYEQQGSGMGLIIARRLIELHGGEMKIDSQLEKGTTITIRLP